MNITVGGIAAGTIGHRAFKGRPAYQERRNNGNGAIINPTMIVRHSRSSKGRVRAGA